jgi:hypothetical protein
MEKGEVSARYCTLAAMPGGRGGLSPLIGACRLLWCAPCAHRECAPQRVWRLGVGGGGGGGACCCPRAPQSMVQHVPACRAPALLPRLVGCAPRRNRGPCSHSGAGTQISPRQSARARTPGIEAVTLSVGLWRHELPRSRNGLDLPPSAAGSRLDQRFKCPVRCIYRCFCSNTLVWDQQQSAWPPDPLPSCCAPPCWRWR